MPNLVGIFDPRADMGALDADLSKMMIAVDYPNFDFVRCRVSAPSIACGNVLPGMENNRLQPARHEDLWLMLDGEILGDDTLKRDLEQAGVSNVDGDDAALALLAYRTFGLDFVHHLNGCFNIVVHDPSARRTYVITDRHGSRLLFFARDGERFAFANELKGVIAGRSVRSRPGGVGLLQLMSTGGHNGDGTWIEGIELIPPGTIVALEEGRIRTNRYYKLRFNEGAPDMSEADYASAFAAALKKATERNLRDSEKWPVAITLSGGLDSRAVALSIDDAYLPIPSITYGAANSPDVVYAAQLAEVIGFDHHYIEPHAQSLIDKGVESYRKITGDTGAFGFFSSQVDRIIWRCEALTLFDGLGSLLWHPIYKPLMRFMLNGAAGDAMTGSHITPNLMLAPTREQVMRDLLSRAYFQSDAALERIFEPRFYRRFRGARDETFLDDFAQIDADEPTAVANIWDMENRQRRGAFTSFTIERYFCTCRSPFLDYELIDLLARVPARWRFQQRIYKRMLVDHHPRAAHVPWAYTEGRITTSPTFEFAREVFNFVKTRAEALRPSRGAGPSRWVFRDHVKLLREDEALHQYLMDFTKRDDFPSDVFSASGVVRLSEDYRRDGSTEHYALFTHLVGIAKSMELMLSPSTIAVPDVADPSKFGVDPT